MSLLKFFNRDFDFGEAYIHIATSTYAQVLHAVSAALKPWDSVVRVVDDPDLIIGTSHNSTGTSHNSIGTINPMVGTATVGTPRVPDQIIGSCVVPSPTFQPHYAFARRWDRVLDFLSLPEGSSVKYARHSLNILMEVPLMIILLMQLNANLLRFHAPVRTINKFE